MNRALLAIAVAALGCAGDALPSGDDANPDASTGCQVFLTFDPPMALASPTTQIRATATVEGSPGVPSYQWYVSKNGVDVDFEYAQLDQSAITFAAADAGPRNVMVAVSGSGFCPTAQSAYNVGVPGGNLEQVRLRIFPPPTVAAPPVEKLVLVPGGAGFSLGNVPVDPGISMPAHVRAGTTGVAAYLRFIPLGAPDAYVETFSGSDGAFERRMLNQVHDVLVVPTVAGFAPRLVEGWMPGTPVITVDAGSSITGVVRDPAGNPVAGAQVQLALDGVPSTLATTTGAGTFTVLAKLPAGVPEVRVDVTPPMASGLPRISASSSALSTTSAFTIQYAAALARRDLGGAVVRRGGVAQPNAPVKIVGTIGAVATVVAGGAPVSANGGVRIATTTNGSGAIPGGTLAPAAPLFAVSTIGAQLAVDAIDLTSSVPSTIDAPVAIPLATELRDAAQAPLPNAFLELAPAGPLAMAGAPTLRAQSNAGGDVTLAVPAGGRFDVRAFDPLGRAAPLIVTDVAAASLATAYALKPALHVTGSLALSGTTTQPVGRATVQILCTLCTGAERSRPLAEGSSSSAGQFDVAVGDPGVGQ